MTSTALWTSQEVLSATGGQAVSGREDWTASGVSIDSRTCNPGDLFVAISGENFDGHRFVPQALDVGAPAAVVSRVPDDISPDQGLVQVDDTMTALESLGLAARARCEAPVIAVTGSVGKTGTKEALTVAFGALGETHATLGNLNNHIGVPLTLARLPRESEFAVIEMGMNHAGEISVLSRFARPDIAIITTIAAVHLEFFDSVAGIADAKAEIFEGMSDNGTAILNRDNVYFAVLAGRAAANGVEKVIGFGAHPDADARLDDCTLSADGSDVSANICGTRVKYRLNVAGRHWVHNSLAVLAAVHAAGADVERAAAALSQLAAPRGRGAQTGIRLADGVLTVIDDSYNASPASMRAAIEILATSAPEAGGRRIAVLGDMLELGATARDLHAALASDLEANGIDLVFCAGQHMAALHEALPQGVRGGYAESSEALVRSIVETVRAGDFVMVKGSFGSRMAVVVDALLGLDTGNGNAGEAQRAL